MAAPTPEPLRLGATFYDRYEVTRTIESGGMGTVYEVLDRRTQRQRALKTMHPNLVVDSDLRARFHFEATATAVVQSDHIVEVLDAGIDVTSSMPYLVMELLQGENLGSLLGVLHGGSRRTRRRGRSGSESHCRATSIRGFSVLRHTILRDGIPLQLDSCRN